MQEDLLGYLLGALEPDEMQRVENMLRESEEARRMLADLERKLRPLQDDCEVIEPPPGDLISRTMDSLPPLPRIPGRESSPAAASVEPASNRATMTPVLESGGTSTWSWRDWFGSITAASVLLAVAIPSIVEGRFAARREFCQDNLRQLGTAMTQFVNRNAEARLPSVDSTGHQAFAGVYAPRLHDSGLLLDPKATFCPSIGEGVFWTSRGLMDPGGLPAVHPTIDREAHSATTLVTLRMLDDAARDLSRASIHGAGAPAEHLPFHRAINRLRWLQQTAGGHYAYTLGVRDGGIYASPRFQGRSSFAMMSDAALMQGLESWMSESGNGRANMATSLDGFISHGGRGINVLYEDGRVRFLPRESLGQMPDNPLLNHDGRSEAGVTIDDASLAPSWQPPFVRTRQR